MIKCKNIFLGWVTYLRVLASLLPFLSHCGFFFANSSSQRCLCLLHSHRSGFFCQDTCQSSLRQRDLFLVDLVPETFNRHPILPLFPHLWWPRGLATGHVGWVDGWSSEEVCLVRVVDVLVLEWEMTVRSGFFECSGSVTVLHPAVTRSWHILFGPLDYLNEGCEPPICGGLSWIHQGVLTRLY